MNFRYKYTAALVPVFFILFIFIGCKISSPVDSSGEKMISVTDFRGKTIHLQQPALRVVCLIESALTGIYMLNAEKSVLGIPYDVYTGAVAPRYRELDNRIADRSLATPGNWDFVSIEQIVSLEPDLVIIWASQTEAIANIEKFGIPVYAVMLNGIEDIYKEIEDFGFIFNREERADSLINFTKNKIRALSEKNRQEEPQRAYFMWAQGINHTSGINSTVNELLEAAGTINVVDMPQEHLTVNVERIIEWNPDIIVMWYNEKLSPDDVINHPLLQGINATRDKRVFMLPSVFDCDLWTLKIVHAVKLVNHWAYNSSESFYADEELGSLLKHLYPQKQFHHTNE